MKRLENTIIMLGECLCIIATAILGFGPIATTYPNADLFASLVIGVVCALLIIRLDKKEIKK